ncbi:hypothetical protein D3C72_480950 [compost metagenome]
MGNSCWYLVDGIQGVGYGASMTVLHYDEPQTFSIKTDWSINNLGPMTFEAWLESRGETEEVFDPETAPNNTTHTKQFARYLESTAVLAFALSEPAQWLSANDIEHEVLKGIYDVNWMKGDHQAFVVRIADEAQAKRFADQFVEQ